LIIIINLGLIIVAYASLFIINQDKNNWHLSSGFINKNEGGIIDLIKRLSQNLGYLLIVDSASSFVTFSMLLLISQFSVFNSVYQEPPLIFYL